ncbi:helix-turn-helix transcriptional regulator [Halococcus agarilyticus]|uniref:helix-turn-helix transcriptional regulator n=1 Tax=Halococcus agarilyticus TaxID=1232219 RepID=UPI000677CACB|nr:hypothetical protein [Halococcus agarilyticus]
MRLRAVLCALLVVAAVGPAVALGQPGTDAGEAANSTEATTTITIQPRPDGDARFRIVTEFTLRDRNDTAAFRALAREFEEGRAGVEVATFEQAAAAATNATGRPMNVTATGRNATIVGENGSDNGTGRLVVGFTWTAFARQSGDRLVVGDAFNTTRGTWLPHLTDGQTLLVETPRGYTIDTSPIGYTNRTLRWNGPESFEPGEPRVIYERSGPPIRSPSANGTDDGSGNDGNGGSDGNADGPGPLASVPPLVFGAGAVVLGAGIVIVGMYTWTRREPDDDGRSADGSTPRAPDTADADPEATPATAGAGSTVEPETTASEPPDDELLSDEERVERLLEHNDGRMKQASIVDETGWSNAKVSQLLSAMDDTGRIEKLRIGRENLISLPDRDDERV